MKLTDEQVNRIEMQGWRVDTICPFPWRQWVHPDRDMESLTDEEVIDELEL